ncbi:MAG: DNA-3-methyladenine glycosylase I [Patescibacteria group bacterium]
MVKKIKNKSRCAWPGLDELMIKYHDEEWGRPCHDDAVLFEYVVLDTFQAGLSWRIILHKRENFRRALDNFAVEKIARYDERKIELLLTNAGLIRNRLKMFGLVKNAQAARLVKKEFGSLDQYFWQFVGGRTKDNRLKSQSRIAARSRESDAMSADMKRRGFSFCGSTVCYAFMQGAGIINDHLVTCFRHAECQPKNR